MAVKAREALEGKDFKLKKLFYTLRAALAARWTIVGNGIPPVQFSGLLTLVDDAKILTTIDALIQIKAGQNEAYRHATDQHLASFIDSVLQQNSDEARKLTAGKSDTKALSNFLYRTAGV